MVSTVRAVEQHLDAAYAASGDLARALVQAQQERQLSAIVGQKAFAALAKAQMSTIEARGHAVDGHRILDQIGKRLGIDLSMYGDVRKDDGVVATPSG